MLTIKQLVYEILRYDICLSRYLTAGHPAPSTFTFALCLATFRNILGDAIGPPIVVHKPFPKLFLKQVV
jgi:hypothetical protein